MERRFAFAALLVLTVLVSTVGFVSADFNAPQGVDPSVTGTTYTFTLSAEGTSYSPSTPTSLASKTARDTYTMTISSYYKLKVTIILADCCSMGDTIALYRPLTNMLASAKSPHLVLKTYTLSPGTYTFYVGYVAASGWSSRYFIGFFATCGQTTVCS